MSLMCYPDLPQTRQTKNVSTRTYRHLNNTTHFYSTIPTRGVNTTQSSALDMVARNMLRYL